MTSSLLSLESFQTLSGIPDSGMMWLLKNKKLHLVSDDDQGVLVDVKKTPVDQLVKALAQNIKADLQSHEHWIQDRLGRILAEEFDELRKELLKQLQNVAPLDAMPKG